MGIFIYLLLTFVIIIIALVFLFKAFKDELKKGANELKSGVGGLGGLVTTKINEVRKEETIGDSNHSKHISKIRSSAGNNITDSEREYLWGNIMNNRSVPCINCKNLAMFKHKTIDKNSIWYCSDCGQKILLSDYGNEYTFICLNLGIDTNLIK